MNVGQLPVPAASPLRRWTRAAVWTLVGLMMGGAGRADTVASLLGNFTINQYCRVALEPKSAAVQYVLVFGQLPALRELHLADTDGDGVTTQAERDAYVATQVRDLIQSLSLRIDGAPLPLHALRWTTSLPTEQGGFSLRVDVDFAADLPPLAAHLSHDLAFRNDNYPGRMGWHEIVLAVQPGLAAFDTNAFDTSLTDGLRQALRELPAAGPLDEREVHAKFVLGAAPPGAVQITARPGTVATGGTAALGTATLGTAASGTAASGIVTSGTVTSGAPATPSTWIERETRRLVVAISDPHLEPRLALLALLSALALGAVHALSPGHGKTVVGAYLVGSRGTPRHAVFLSLTVTITHTLGVFALGFATLYAARFIMPERLFPILSLIAALLVLGMGFTLLVRRLAAARGSGAGGFGASTAHFEALPSHGRPHGLLLSYGAFAPAGMHARGALMHSHGGGPMHSHLPPGAAGEKVTWRSLLALGVSGGLVPCPSALVLLLAAVALHKTFYGMVLVTAFSCGLALTLTAVGLMFLYARHRLGSLRSGSRWQHWMPVASAATITAVGLCLSYAALQTLP